MNSPVEQRSENRYNCFVPVESKKGYEFDSTKTFDISRHGMGFLSLKPVAVNQKIALEIILKPNTEPVMVIGVVKWVRKIEVSNQYRVGMTFSDVISGSPARFDKYLKSKHLERKIN
ncbi:MAG: PilZ domain-containing protein [Candidatus Omnitrophica bacterium]|nr:PilZ domain-containing protein [Candidatus Omnitrophota bacterium]